MKAPLSRGRECGYTQRNEACDVSPSQKLALRDARGNAVRSLGARSPDVRSRAGSRLGLPARDASVARKAPAQEARREGAHERLVAPARAGRCGDTPPAR